jgi:hypothetical protein
VLSMRAESITIAVEPQIAEAFRAAPAEEQQKIEMLINLWLKEMVAADRSALKEIINEMRQEAQSKGLTPEILESILHER